MKRIIRAIAELILCGLIGLLICAAAIGAFALLVTMPDILSWVSSYIGTTTTWVLFIFIIVAVILYCVAE